MQAANHPSLFTSCCVCRDFSKATRGHSFLGKPSALTHPQAFGRNVNITFMVLDRLNEVSC